MVNLSDCEVCFCDAQGDVMAARAVGILQEGVNPCRMVPSMRDEVHVQLHDVTGKVQSAGCELPCKMREVRVAARNKKKKKMNWRTKASLSFG